MSVRILCQNQPAAFDQSGLVGGNAEAGQRGGGHAPTSDERWHEGPVRWLTWF